MSKPADKDKGVLFNIDFTGKIINSAVGQFALFLNILIGTDINLNQIYIYGCEDQGVNISNCKDSAHYTKLIGTMNIDSINNVKVATLDIRKNNDDLVSIYLNDSLYGVTAKFLPEDKTKIFILIKGCVKDSDCSVRNDFFVGGIYSSQCKNTYLII